MRPSIETSQSQNDPDTHSSKTMQALVYRGPDQIQLEERPRPQLIDPGDAIVRITMTTLCGTDLHILKGDVPEVALGRILGHEGVGIIEELGSDVRGGFHTGDKVLISLISSCGKCLNCKKGMFSHCSNGGWLLGHHIDGTQAEYVRIPYAQTSLYLLPTDADDEAMVLLSCMLPTGMECATLKAQVNPGDVLAIVGAGPVGFASLLTAQLYSPAEIILIDRDPHRLETAHSCGATHVVNSSDGTAAEQIMVLTQGRGVDVAIEAVGMPETFELCQAIIAPGGRIANVGVHGKAVTLHLETLWASNITLSTSLVNASSTALLLKMLLSGRLDTSQVISHRFVLDDIIRAYDTFAHATREKALKVLVSIPETLP